MHWSDRIKRDTALVMLQESAEFFVYVYTNREGVVCPKHLIDDDGPSLVPFSVARAASAKKEKLTGLRLVKS